VPISSHRNSEPVAASGLGKEVQSVGLKSVIPLSHFVFLLPLLLRLHLIIPRLCEGGKIAGKILRPLKGLQIASVVVKAQPLPSYHRLRLAG
jgi:hypothetical protein